MGYLLKEALKTLCGVNQWSYAVFWKISCQNPKLLIWEEYYYETASCSGLLGNENPETSLQDYDASWISTETRNLGDKVQSIITKMMMDNHVNTVGEGLVGRVAFTGIHQWILSSNYFGEPRPPEVLKEMSQQFSAGMQTIAVIPVLPHGVVQFGSNKIIMENVAFVNDVTSLILQLGYIPGVLLSEDYIARELDPGIGLGNSAAENFPIGSDVTSSTSSLFNNNYNYERSLDQHNVWQSNVASFEASNSNPVYLNMDSTVNLDLSFPNQSINGVTKAEVIIPSTSEIWMNQNDSLYIPRSIQELSYTSLSTEISSRGDFSNTNVSTMSTFKDEKEHHTTNTKCDDQCEQPPQSGDDLLDFLGADFFDILGADYKSKLFSSSWNNTHNSWEICSTSQGKTDKAVLTDPILDDMVSKDHSSGKKSLNENISSRTNTSTSSAANASLPYGMKGELLGVPKYLANAGVTSSCSLGDSRTYSQSSSIYGSQVSSWIEKGHQNSRRSNSVSSELSKKTDETGKTNRKRLKPGENARPRPKDRQMMQERVKELREIVPNATKCSIDALLERTIKHMLFLQSLRKHADKLKQTGESKIISKDGGLFLKDNFDGGATWAYEVGSIIVEDLNQPRQMLVEMLCEKRGLLEIADIIRGLGLTILKGIIETRNEKIWARFTVEANRDVTRMEISNSLVRLLEQSAKNGLSQSKGISIES